MLAITESGRSRLLPAVWEKTDRPREGICRATGSWESEPRLSGIRSIRAFEARVRQRSLRRARSQWWPPSLYLALPVGLWEVHLRGRCASRGLG